MNKKTTFNAQPNLYEIQSLLNQTQSLSGIGSWKLDLIKNKIHLSDQLLKIFGWSRKKSYHVEDFYRSVHLNDIHRVRHTVQKVIKEAGEYAHTYRFIRPDGQTRLIKSEGRGNVGAHEKVIEVIGVAQDITDQDAKQRELKTLSLIAQETSDAVIILDQKGIIQWVNRAFTEVSGFSSTEVLNHHLDDFLHGPETNPTTQAYKNEMIAQGKSFHCELIKYRKSGEKFWMEVQGYPFYDEQGNFIKYIQIESDITKRKLELLNLRQGQQKSKSFAKEMIKVLEQERSKISLELHDQLGQELIGMKMLTSMLRSYHVGDKEKKILKELAKMIDDSLTTTKSISTRLRPAILDKLGLVSAIEWLVEDIQKKSTISIYLTVRSSPRIYDKLTSITFFRICQEAMNNAIKHSRATKLTVSLEEVSNYLILSIVDNGVGMDIDKVDKPLSLGIIGMRERAEFIHGDFNIESKPTYGTKVQLKVPIEPRDQNANSG